MPPKRNELGSIKRKRDENAGENGDHETKVLANGADSTVKRSRVLDSDRDSPYSRRSATGTARSATATPRPTASVLDDLLGDLGEPTPAAKTPASGSSTVQSGTTSPPRKRAGGTSSLKQAADARRKQREAEELASVHARGQQNVVSAHYNAVPQRGREWRKAESQIKGLRSFNNWIKSTVIQKFSIPDMPTPNLLVLDIGAGKGGDLGKWQSAPQVPALYVGLDPAQISVDQARERYEEMRRRQRGPQRGPPRNNQQLFDAHFHVKDCFGESLAQIPIVQQVGFDPHAGPDGHLNITGRPGRGGFDVVSMMFCLHYSYESEQNARGMLRNVVGALKKGGRFIGVMPNSDVISARLVKHLRGGKSPAPAEKKPEKSMYDEEDEDDWDPEKPSSGPAAASNGADNATAEQSDDDWDPEKPMGAAAATAQGDDWDPEAPIDAPSTKAPSVEAKTETPKSSEPLEWGNGIYTVKFPGERSLPHDGVFRPPFGWKYFYYLEEAVALPEYVVPWEGFRALAEEYGLEMLYRKPFDQVWEEEKNDKILGPLSERMGVRSRDGRMNVTPEEMEAASFYHAFCFYKI